MWSAGCVLFFAAHGAEVEQRVTPVEKVTELLVKLKAEVIEEGKKEKAMFQKFEDFCDFQENEKYHQANKGAKRYYRLVAEIEQHDANIDSLGEKIDEKNESIESTEGDIAEATTTMEETSANDAQSIADLDYVISQCERAIKHLKASDVTNTGLIAIASTETVMNAAMRLEHRPSSLERLAALLSKPGKAHGYKFHSQEVIKLLENLRDEFKSERVEKDNQAMASRSQSEKTIQQLRNAVAAETNQKNEFQQEQDRNSQEKAEKEADKDQTQKDLHNNVSFAHHLVGCKSFKGKATSAAHEDLENFIDGPQTENEDYEDDCVECDGEECGGEDEGECGRKRFNYASRVKTRGEELEALTQAIELMQGKGGNKYSANKKLVGLVRRHVRSLAQKAESADQDNDDDDEEDGSDVSFLQHSHSRDAGRERLIRFLSMEAKSLQSPTLSALLLKVKVDHFEKVRALIADLIARLQDQKESEAKQKQWCDEQLEASHKKQDTAEANIQQESSTIDTEKANVSSLTRSIEQLQNEISEAVKAKAEAQSIRDQEKTDNKLTVDDAKEGAEAVENAIEILKSFYEGAAGSDEFVQLQESPEKVEKHEEWRAQGSDASGNTIADLRPESDAFEGGYAGKQKKSKGILGLLNVILSDYQRTVKTVSAEEKENAENHDQFVQDTDSEIAAKKDEVKTKKGERDASNEAISDAEENLKDARTNYEISEGELKTLRELCSSAEAEEQKEERRARRKQEVEALKEALNILREVGFLAIV